MESNNRATTAAINSLLRRGDEALAAEDWDGAAEYYERALEANAQNGPAYLSLFLATRHLLNVDELQGVARQIVSETPAERGDLGAVLQDEARAGQEVDAEAAGLLGIELPKTEPQDAEGAAAQSASGDAPDASSVEGASASPDQTDAASREVPEGGQVADAASTAQPEAAAASPVPPASAQRQVRPASPSNGAAAASSALRVRASYPQRFSNLKLSVEAFDRTFEDENWKAAYELGGLEQRRHMERARADAEAVFQAAFDDEHKLLATMCERAKVRIPRVRRITTAALTSCDEALANFATASGERKQEVSQEYAFLGNNLRTAQACLWVGGILIVVGAVLLGLAIIPRGNSVQNNAFAAFPEYFVPLGIVLVLAGVVLLGLRALLVRSNRETISERQASAGTTKSSLVQDSDLLNTRVAAVRSRCHSLEALPLDASDEGFEKSCSDLDATVKALTK